MAEVYTLLDAILSVLFYEFFLQKPEISQSSKFCVRTVWIVKIYGTVLRKLWLTNEICLTLNLCTYVDFIFRLLQHQITSVPCVDC